MHSSRMRTGRTLTVFRWRPPSPQKFQTPPRKFQTPPPRKFQTPPLKISDTPPENFRHPPRKFQTPLVNRMTNRCKNITLAKTSFRPVITVVTDLCACCKKWHKFVEKKFTNCIELKQRPSIRLASCSYIQGDYLKTINILLSTLYIM